MFKHQRSKREKWRQDWRKSRLQEERKRAFDARKRSHWQYSPPFGADWHRFAPYTRHQFLRSQHRGKLFFRFSGIFGFMALLVISALLAAGILIVHFFTNQGNLTVLPLFVCGLALMFPLLATFVGRIAFKNIATPLADLIEVIGEVSKGNLEARVPPTRIHSEFSDLNQSVNQMIEELEQTDRLRRNLTADVAHELRTPLHIIQGNLEGILDGVYEPSATHLNAMLEETHALSRLVDDLQTLSLAETGALEIAWECVDIIELVDDVYTSFSSQAQTAGIVLQKSISGDPEQLIVMGDAGRLDQALSNLVNNALNHTPANGHIIIGAEPDQNQVRLVVRDSGEGIPEENLSLIFERFWRGDHSRSRSRGSGSGLGLAIAQHLVKVHGGQIEVVSELGHGSTFTIILPREPTEESKKE